MMNTNEVDISNKVKNLIKYGLIVMLLLGAGIAGLVWTLEEGSDKIVIQDAKIATDMVVVRAQTEGTIEELLVQDGDMVEAGTVLAKLKVNVTPEQVEQLEQTVELSKRNLAQVMQGTMINVPVAAPKVSAGNSAAVEAAKRRLDRMNQLLEMGAVSAVERDAAAAELAEIEAITPVVPETLYETRFQPSSPEVIRNAEMAVKQAEMALELARSSAQGTEITADVEGTVHLGDLQPGSQVKPGQAVMNIGKAENLWVEAHISPEQQGKIKLGDLAYYTINKQNYKGTVMEIILPEEPKEGEEASDTEGQVSEQEAKKITMKISIPQEAVNDARLGQQVEVRLGN